MLKIGDNFDYQGKLPNFNRDTFETKALMKAYPETSIDEGHISLCLEDGKLYQYSSKNSVSTQTGKWKLIVDTTLSTTSENPVQNKAISKKFADQEALFAQKLTEAGKQILSTIQTLEKLVKDNERITSAGLYEITTTLRSTTEVIAYLLQDLNLHKLDSDIEINGINLGGGSITLTKNEIGLGNVDNTSDALKPISTATQAALDTKVDKVSGSRLMTTEEGNKLGALPTNDNLQTALSQKVGKSTTVNGFSLTGNIEIQSDDIKLTSDNTTTVFDELGKKVPSTRKVAGKTLANDILLNSSDVGLGNVNNTADEDKPISRATQGALDTKVDKVPGSSLITSEEKEKLKNIPVGSEINSHISSKTNPHQVTKAQVGLGDVDNTADLDKPISNLTQQALNGKVGKDITINGHALSESITITKRDIGLGNADNTPDVSKPISTLQQAALDKKVDKTITVNSHPLSGNVTITKGDIGLGSVDNTSDLEKPLSTATKTELGKKADKTTTINGYPLSANVTLAKSDVGLGSVDNTADTNKPVSGPQQKELDKKVDKTITVNSHPLSGNIVVTKADVGLGDVENTSDLDKPISTATQGALDRKVDKTITVNGHALSSNVTITKGDVGLGNVDNTADSQKPVSTPQQRELDKKVDKTITVNGHALSSNITVTKEDVGLGNVDNTSDIDKPISTAQRTELDKIERVVANSAVELERKIREGSEITSAVLNNINSTLLILLDQNRTMLQTLQETLTKP